MNGRSAQPIAVTLAWDGRDAPRVTATGRGDLAERIRSLAAEHEIPLYQDWDLVELLAQVPLGDEIPRELYVAVAEVIAFAYRISGRDPETTTNTTGHDEVTP